MAPKVDPKRSAAAKKAAATRRANLQTQQEHDQWEVWEKRIRDIIIFLLGVAGVINELVFRDETRVQVLVFLGGVIGAPSILAIDAKRRARG